MKENVLVKEFEIQEEKVPLVSEGVDHVLLNLLLFQEKLFFL